VTDIANSGWVVNMIVRKVQLLGLAAMMTVMWGCGYSTRRPFTPKVKTIYVKPFGSKIFRRRIELDLTEAVKKRIQMDTLYRLADEGNADTVLAGEVLSVKQGTLGRSFGTSVPRETQFTLTVSLQWKDLRSGKILMERERWLQAFDYARPVGEREFDARQGAIDRMAERIVEQMETDW